MEFYDNAADNHNANQEKATYAYLNILDSPNLFKEIKETKGKAVLEIGSGTGRITEKIIQENPSKLVCIESSSKTRKILKVKFPKLTIKSSLSDIKCKFDYIIFVHTLIHINEKEKFFDKIAKILNSGGKIVLSELFQEKPLYSLDKGGKKVFQKIYPINIIRLKRYIKDKGFSIIKEDLIKVDKNKVPPFENSEINKKLTFFWVLLKK